MRPTPPRLGFVFATVVALLSNGCVSYPEGITKAEWEKMPPAQRSWIRRNEERQRRKLEESHPKNGRVLDDVIKADQRSRDIGPLLDQ